MKQITLSDKEYKLLMKILQSDMETRSDMSCNDPYEEEEKLFTKKERIEITKAFYEYSEDVEDMDGFLFNSQYVEHIISKIKSNTVKIK